jgi:hypothetical protein
VGGDGFQLCLRIDWLITVPLLMIEFYLILAAIASESTGRRFLTPHEQAPGDAGDIWAKPVISVSGGFYIIGMIGLVLYFCTRYLPNK